MGKKGGAHQADNGMSYLENFLKLCVVQPPKANRAIQRRSVNLSRDTGGRQHMH
jgi:hypothetical protein